MGLASELRELCVRLEMRELSDLRACGVRWCAVVRGGARWCGAWWEVRAVSIAA